MPSRHHDPFASLVVGGSAELRTRGGFEILLHQSTRIEAKGPTRVRVDALNEQSCSLSLSRVSFLRVRVNSRAHQIVLPDGSALKITPPAPPGALGGLAALFGGSAQPEVTRPAFIEIVRLDAPSAYPGRVSITNYGGDPVTLDHAFGAVQIAPEQRVEVLLSKPTVAAAGALLAGDARVDLDGERATCKAAGATSVEWSGARFHLPSGAVLKLRSLGRAIQLDRVDG